MTILDEEDYPAIRAVLDVSLSRTDLPDDTIEQDVFLGRAEAELLARVPDAASRTGAELLSVKRALVYLTAAALAHSVVRITALSVQGRDTMKMAKAIFDPDEKAAELRSRAEHELGQLLTPDEVTPARPTMFAVMHGTRGR